jgi:hypothetical protein
MISGASACLLISYGFLGFVCLKGMPIPPNGLCRKKHHPFGFAAGASVTAAQLGFTRNLLSEERALRKRHGLVIWLMIFGLVLAACCITVPAVAQTPTHTVKKGDTLWSICEKYYGNSNLWPKLWQMNPFVTNPHLLKEGDTIKLLEGVPIKKTAAAKKPVKAAPPSSAAPAAEIKTGINVSGMTNVDSNGYLSMKKVRPWGRIVSTEGEGVVLSKGDNVCVAVEKGRIIKPGDQFTIFNSSKQQKHPFLKKEVGYVLMFQGKLVIKEQVKRDLFKAEIVEFYRAIRLKAPVLPYQPISPCVELMPLKHRKVNANIVAVKELNRIIGHFSVVYIDNGYEQGIRRGNILKIVKKRQLEYPEKRNLPDVDLGALMVLETRKNTSTCVVVLVKGEIRNGAFVTALDWKTANEIVSDVPLCRIE